MIERLNGALLTPPQDAASGSTTPGEKAARFQEAVAQASARAETGTVSAGPLHLHPQMLNAADDAWLEVVATAEQLREPLLSDEHRHTLLKSLAESWRSFQSRSEPITQLLDDYGIDEKAGGPAAGQDLIGPGGDL
jgi:hypothetical protein